MLADESGLNPYHYEKNYEEVEDETMCIIHSSGTTGEFWPCYSIFLMFARLIVSILSSRHAKAGASYKRILERLG